MQVATGNVTPSKSVSLRSRRSPLSRQPVLTHHHRRHVIVSKSTSLPHMDHFHHDDQTTDHSHRDDHIADHSHRDDHIADHSHRVDQTADHSHRDDHIADHSDCDDYHDQTIDLVRTQDRLDEAEAIFIPGRLLGVSDSLCVRPVVTCCDADETCDPGDVSSDSATVLSVFDDDVSTSSSGRTARRCRRRQNVQVRRPATDRKD